MLKILLSAFACEPYKGSEPGVGWNIAMELAKSNNVTVVTSIEHKKKIEEYSQNNCLPFGVVYHGNYTLNKIMIRLPLHLGYNLYALYWYKTVKKTMKELQKKNHFDVAHHLTWATFKYYDPVCELGIPYVIGPVGGGEKTPAGFSKDFSFMNKIMDAIRLYHLKRSLKNVNIQRMLHNANKVIATTPETASVIKPFCEKNCVIMQAIGLNKEQILISKINKPSKKNSEKINLLFLGELKFWKGIDILISVAIEMKKNNADYHFNIVGAGHDESEFKRKVEQLELSDLFTFHGRLTYENAMQEYQNNDIFVYPSYHDSGALVVLEAMAKRIPVVVLDTGGPGFNVKKECGFKVPISNTLKETAIDFYAEIEHISDIIKSGKIDSYINNATKYLLQECLWSNRAKEIQKCYDECTYRHD